jgi:hypothetical protein
MDMMANIDGYRLTVPYCVQAVCLGTVTFWQ